MTDITYWKRHGNGWLIDAPYPGRIGWTTPQLIQTIRNERRLAISDYRNGWAVWDAMRYYPVVKP